MRLNEIRYFIVSGGRDCKTVIWISPKTAHTTKSGENKAMNNHGYLSHAMNYHQFMAAASKISDEYESSKKEVMRLAFSELISSVRYVPQHKPDLLGAVIFNLINLCLDIDQVDDAQVLLEDWSDELTDKWVKICQHALNNPPINGVS